MDSWNLLKKIVSDIDVAVAKKQKEKWCSLLCFWDLGKLYFFEVDDNWK